MTEVAEVPKYRLLRQSFIGSNLIEAGSIIRFKGPPGHHFEPLNEPAKAALEEWFNAEIEEVDQKTGRATGNMIKPRMKLKLKPYEAGVTHEAEIVALPKLNAEPIQTLAEIQFSRAVASVRPGPEKVPDAVEDLEVEHNAPPPVSTVKKTA